MNNDVEDRLREGLHSARLPTAPEAVRTYVADLSGRPVEVAPRLRSRFSLLLPLAIAVVGFMVFSVGSLAPQVSTAPIDGSSPASDLLVDGLPVQTVSELLRARTEGKAPGGPYALQGYWTVRGEGSSCGPPLGGPPGELEIFCHDGQFGITEGNEPILFVRRTGLGQTVGAVAASPHLTPWVPSEKDHDRLWELPAPNWSPIPIVVVGHFDDALAVKCREGAVQKCLDRFVIDRIVAFEPTSLPQPEPTATATPFPVANPPKAPFTDAQCYAGIAKSFAGWAKLRELDIVLRPGWDPEAYVFAMTTRDVVPIGDPTVSGEDTWHESADYPGHQIRWWGRRVCFAEDSSTLYSGSVIGTTYIEVDDGRHIDAPYPFG